MLALAVLAYFVFRAIKGLWPSPEKLGDVVHALVQASHGLRPMKGGYDSGDLTLGVSWLLLAGGIFFVPLALFLLGFLRRHGAYRWALHAPATSLSARATFLNRVALISGLCVSILLAKSIDLSWEHFEYAGRRLLLYSLGRVTLVACLGLVFVGLGQVLAHLASSPTTRRQDPVGGLLVAFFLGATFCAIIAIALGFFGLLKLPVAVPLVIAAAWVGGPAAAESLRALAARAVRILLRTGRNDLLVVLALGWCCAVMGLYLVISYGLYPVTIDTDVWEHYLHYYRAVLRDGSLGPNEVWYHYYLSKGAGLFFLAGVLSDFFAPQLVTLLAFGAILLVVYDLLRGTVRDTRWALLGVLLLVSFLYGNDNSGAFFKHHGMFFAYAAFLSWAVVRLGITPQEQSRPLRVAAALAALYIGFYLPLISTLVGTMLALAGLSLLWIPGARQAARPVGIAVLAVACGALLAFGVNFVGTGMAEMVPIRLFWRFADQSRLDANIGESGVAYFSFVDSDLKAITERSLHWLIGVLRIGTFAPILNALMLLLVGTTLLAWVLERNKSREWKRILLVGTPLIGLVLPAVILAWFAQIDSVQRMYVFMAFISTIFGVWVLWVVSTFYPPAALRAVATSTVISVAALAMLSESLQNAGERLVPAARFILGRLSFAEALYSNERLLKTDRITRLDEYRQTRRHELIGPARGLFALTYDPGFGYSLPGAGVRSEPSYSAGPRYSLLARETPREVADRLRRQGVEFFFLNLQAPLFSSVAFSSLFAPDAMAENFRVVLRWGNTYVLAWADGGFGVPMPEHLLRVVELKRTGALHAPFSSDFAEELRKITERSELAQVAGRRPDDALSRCPDLCRQYFSEVVAAVKRRMYRNFSIKENEALAARVEATVAQVLHNGERHLVGRALNELRTASRTHPRPSFATVLASQTCESIKKVALAVISEELGDPLGYALATRDERRPFGLILSQRATP